MLNDQQNNNKLAILQIRSSEIQILQMLFNSYQDIEEYAAKQSRLLVVYDTHVLDVTTFATHHPGGAHLITRYSSKDITPGMQGHFPLSLQLANSMTIGTLDKEIRLYLNRDLPILPQIWNMDHDTYMRIVHLPHWIFQLSPRLFESDFMESLSYCYWYNIFIVQGLLMIYYFLSQVQYHWHPISPLEFIATFFGGFLFFTLIQYLLHRFIFHSQKRLYDSRVLRYIHFITHGNHHMFPFDPLRLVLPPTFSGVIVLIGYFTVYNFVYFNDLVYDFFFYLGFFVGYWCYDLMHYLIHHLETNSLGDDNIVKRCVKRIFLSVKAHHNQHHYSKEEAGYGVSSPLWDWILRTDFKLKRG